MAAAGAAQFAGAPFSGCGGNNNLLGNPAPSCAKITDIDHVVILMQENRSFDHYFGSYRGVRGFADRSAAFQQPIPATRQRTRGVLLPFHIDTTK